MNEEISNHRFQGMLKRYIREHKLIEKIPNIYHCGAQLIKQIGFDSAVFVMKNDNSQTRFFGNTKCHSAWACPSCTAKVMAQKGADIACLIDAMAKWKNKYAFMITFTIPHKNYMTCEESKNLLMKAWRMFSRDGNRKTKVNKRVRTGDIERRNKSYGATYVFQAYRTNKYGKRIKSGIRREQSGSKNEFDQRAKGKPGDIVEYTTKLGAYGTFRNELHIETHVKTYEFTYGENGWHPHIHMLMWVDKKDLNKALKYEQELNDRWWHCVKKIAKDIFKEDITDSLCADWKLKYHKPVFISKDQNGNVIPQKSSHYITGWSGNHELTSSNYKKARGNNLTPYNLLEKAAESKTKEKTDEWLKIYAEYAVATKGNRRVEFSTNGVHDLIRQWKLTADYIEKFKKKFSDKATENWKVVYWFNEQQWKNICWLEATTKENTRQQILRLALNKERLEEYLTSIGIPLTTREHRYRKFVEQSVFENRIYDPTSKMYYNPETGEAFA